MLSQTTAQGFGNVAALLISVQLVAWSAVAADLIRTSFVATWRFRSRADEPKVSVVFIYHMAQANKGFSPVTDHVRLLELGRVVEADSAPQIVSRLLAMSIGTAGVTVRASDELPLFLVAGVLGTIDCCCHGQRVVVCAGASLPVLRWR